MNALRVSDLRVRPPLARGLSNGEWMFLTRSCDVSGGVAPLSREEVGVEIDSSSSPAPHEMVNNEGMESDQRSLITLSSNCGGCKTDERRLIQISTCIVTLC